MEPVMCQFKASTSPQAPPPLGHLNFWRFKFLSWCQNCAQIPCLSAGFHSQSFCKRQDRWPWPSHRPFLLSHLLTKVNTLPLNTSIFKDKTLVTHSKDLGSLVEIPHPTQARFKSPNLCEQTKVKCLKGKGCPNFK